MIPFSLLKTSYWVIKNTLFSFLVLTDCILTDSQHIDIQKEISRYRARVETSSLEEA